MKPGQSAAGLIQAMRFGAFGDVHGDFDVVRRVQGRHPDVPFWVSVGDLGGDAGQYGSPPAPLYWIKGNNEDFDFVARQPAGGGTLPGLHYVPNGALVRLEDLRITGLGGTYAPTQYDTPAKDLFPGRPVRRRRGASGGPARRDDRRRHFVREEVEACRRLQGIDLFLSHEAPRPFFVSTGKPGATRRLDAGKAPINEVLAALRPRLHLCGHHHRFVAAEREGVESICLDVAVRGYLLIESSTMAYERVELT